MKNILCLSIFLLGVFLLLPNTSFSRCNGCDCIEGVEACWAQTVSGGQPGTRAVCVSDEDSCNFCSIGISICTSGGNYQ